MKIRNVKIICILLTIFCIFVMQGCDPGNSLPASKAEQQKLIKKLEVQAGFVLPSGVELLDATDGGGRDPSYEYYCWGLFSSAAITTMPVIKLPYLNGYLNRSLDTVKFVQSYAGKRKIKRTQSVFSSDWEANGYEFRGTIARTLEGDYMVVQRFRIRSEPPHSQKTVVPSSSESQAIEKGRRIHE